jgi:hypothetical protein
MFMLMGRSKYISGVSAFVDEGLAIAITYARDHNYDRIVHIEDIAGGTEDVGYTELRHEIGRVSLVYKGILNGTNTRKIQIRFESGDQVEIEVFVPTYNQKLEISSPYLYSNVNGSSDFFNFTQRLQQGPLKGTNPAAYAMLPIKDPYKRFGYSGAWSYSEEGCAAVFNSAQYEGLDRSVPFIGRPSGGGGVQFAQFAAVLGKGGVYTKAEEVWGDALDGDSSQVVFAFVWAKDLEELPDTDLKQIEVCADPTSPSYYRTTGLDSAGNSIESYYLDGSQKCIFRPGACAVDPSKFTVRVNVQNTLEGGDGKVSIKVLSNDATPPKDPWIDADAYAQDKYPAYDPIGDSDFIFQLIQPKGIGGTLTSGTVTQATWEFEDLKDSLIPYIVRVTDDSTGLRADIPVQVRPDASSDRYCGCGDTDAINYGGTASDDVCSCVDCSTGDLLVGGQPAGHPFMELQQIQTSPASTESSSDGIISFISEVHPGIFSTIYPFLLGATYDIELYPTTGYGVEPTGPATVSVSANATNDYQFEGLEAGWYAIKINLTGELCVTTFWVELTSVEAKTPCESADDVSVAIDPCTGVVTAVVDTDLEHEILFSTGSDPVPSITVAAGDTLYVRVNFPGQECLHLILPPYSVTAVDLNCETTAQTVGCTDPTALNYNPGATIDGGTCVYGRFGCTDPTATNYDPEATASDGSCVYLCSDPIISSVSVSGNIPTIVFDGGETNFTAQWYSPLTGEIIETEDVATGPYLADGTYVLTVTTSIGCTDTYVFSINDDIYYGCIDPLATNYQPAATVPYLYYEGSGTVLSQACEYRIQQSECIPKTLQITLENIQKCISKKSDEFVNNMKAGRLTECTTNDLRVLHLVYYLLMQRGLQCIYNCQDSQTPDPSAISCASKWEEGGPSGEQLIYNPSETYSWGDVVKSPTTGRIYVVTATSSTPGDGPEDPNTTSDWKVCTDTLLPGDVVNRLDGFLAKVKDICLDCGISIEQVANAEPAELVDRGTSIGGDELSISNDTVDL